MAQGVMPQVTNQKKLIGIVNLNIVLIMENILDLLKERPPKLICAQLICLPYLSQNRNWTKWEQFVQSIEDLIDITGYSELDFGIKKQGDTVNVRFNLQNQGHSILHLKKVFGNCNCIRVSPEQYQIQPGAASYIDVRFITNERLGNQEKTITIFSDDPLMPVAILKLKGRLRGSRN